jgi:hypothetical protein
VSRFQSATPNGIWIKEKTVKPDKQQLARLEAATCLGKPMYFKDKGSGKRERWGTVEEEVYIMVADYKHMIQRIRYCEPDPTGDLYGYRACYYTLDKDGRHVKWGQFAQQLSQSQYRELLGKAQAKGWPIFPK